MCGIREIEKKDSRRNMETLFRHFRVKNFISKVNLGELSVETFACFKINTEVLRHGDK